MNYKVAVVGTEPLSLGFSLAGITESYKPENAEDSEIIRRKLMQRNDIGIIAVSSSIIRDVKDRKLQEAVAGSLLPLVIELPEYGEQVAEDTLRKLIIRAIGIDVQANI